MIKTYLIDDEPESIQTISTLIEMSCPHVKIEGRYTDPAEGLIAIQKKKPDVLLLDIDMPGMTGLELLKRLPSIEFEVIFITAYNEYAIPAIKLSALDYILKPVDPDELEKALEKAQVTIDQKKNNRQFEVLGNLMNKNPNIRTSQENNIALPIFEGLQYVNMADILRIEAEQNYCKFYIQDSKPITISKNIGTYESCLDRFGFMRVHRSHIVNLCKVKRFIRQSGLYVELADGSKVEISRVKKDEVLLRLQEL